jgi:hypothetical protein
LGTVQAYVPSEALTPVAIVVHAPPGEVLYERSTVVSDVDVHEIFCDVPACQLSPPLGVRTVTDGGGMMVNTALLESVVIPLLTLTFAVVVGVLGIVQEYVPDEALTPVAIVVHAPPGEVSYERSTVVSEVDVHVIFCDVPICQLSPPLGVTTVTDGMGMMVKSASLESTMAPLAIFTRA